MNIYVIEFTILEGSRPLSHTVREANARLAYHKFQRHVKETGITNITGVIVYRRIPPHEYEGV